jgi:hypothetical protein
MQKTLQQELIGYSLWYFHWRQRYAPLQFAPDMPEIVMPLLWRTIETYLDPFRITVFRSRYAEDGSRTHLSWSDVAEQCNCTRQGALGRWRSGLSMLSRLRHRYAILAIPVTALRAGQYTIQFVRVQTPEQYWREAC